MPWQHAHNPFDKNTQHIHRHCQNHAFNVFESIHSIPQAKNPKQCEFFWATNWHVLCPNINGICMSNMAVKLSTTTTCRTHITGYLHLKKRISNCSVLFELCSCLLLTHLLTYGLTDTLNINGKQKPIGDATLRPCIIKLQ